MIIEEKNLENTHIVPSIDYVFKKILGYEGSEKAIKGLVSNILGREIVSINFKENPNMEKNILSEKFSQLDIKATLDSNIICDIEIQMKNHENFFERMLFYWSKLYSKSLRKGQSYSKLKKTISILILNFDPPEFKELKEFHSEWKILETKCSNIVLTDYLEFHIISLEKLEKMISENVVTNENEKLVIWSKFLLCPEKLDKKVYIENEDIRMAKELLDEFRMNEKEVFLAGLREKAMRDKMILKETAEKKVYNEGVEHGAHKKQLEIARELLKLKLPIEQIVIATKLTKEEIEKLI